MSGVIPADEVARLRKVASKGMGASRNDTRLICDSHEALRSQLAAAHDVIRMFTKVDPRYEYELESPGAPVRWVRIDRVTRSWEVLRDVTPAERAVLDGIGGADHA